MFTFLIYSLALRWGNVSNINVTMKLYNYIIFYHKILGEQKILCWSLIVKSHYAVAYERHNLHNNNGFT